MQRILVFDVNETLLDLAALDPLFERIFGDAGVRREWFLQMVQSALVSIVTNAYSDFGTVAKASLAMTAARRDMPLLESDREEILDAVEGLPPHPDALGALSRLRDAGLRLVTLTNSTLETADAQLSRSGLIDSFEAIFSADEVRRLKPAPDPYRMVAARMGVKTSNLRLVAAHAWDVAGALCAGCAAAFVGRHGMVPDPLAPTPDIIGKDLEEVADFIIDAERRAA
jgi:2-haloacid dehalogenase